MKINKRFNTLTKKEYFHLLNNRKKYTDFNELGIYRSIIENKKLDVADKIEVRDYAHKYFAKTFEFYQIKDPITYMKLTTLGMELSKEDKQKIWDELCIQQQKILKAKRIKHRNFGNYSKHNCGSEHCVLNGIMTKQGSSLGQWSAIKYNCNMIFDSDNNRYELQQKSLKRKKERKAKHVVIRDELLE